RTRGRPLPGYARACGFSSPSHFSHRVKAATGLTPSQLRAAQRG
ncbi:AraC family transcriptional regulator, partial [Stenotrophomonas maltophilia]